MSLAQIISELQKLTPAELTAIRRKLTELSTENNDIAACDASALEASQLLDRMEDEDQAG